MVAPRTYESTHGLAARVAQSVEIHMPSTERRAWQLGSWPCVACAARCGLLRVLAYARVLSACFRGIGMARAAHFGAMLQSRASF
eukprot:4211597-Pleurochrysis_carterae.AAC.1